MHPLRPISVRRRLALTPLALALAFLPACGGPDAPRPAAESDEAARLRQLSSAAADLQSMFENLPAPAEPAAPVAGAPPIARRQPPATVDLPAPSEPPTPAGAADLAADLPAPAPAAEAPAPPQLTPAQRRAQAAELLATAISGEGDDPAFRRALHLALLVGLDPAADGQFASLRAELSPGQQRAADTVRTLAGAIAGDDATEPAELAALLDRAAAAAASMQGLAMPVAALCSRVESFGRFLPLPSATFVVGRPIRALVYVEVANFAHRPLSDSSLPEVADPAGGEWAVELAQELSLFHKDSTLAWRQPAQTVRDLSRNRRRDHYLVQRIELPATLSIGSYNLKLTVRDLAVPGSRAELTIPLQIVADASVAGTARTSAVVTAGAPRFPQAGDDATRTAAQPVP